MVVYSIRNESHAQVITVDGVDYVVFKVVSNTKIDDDGYILIIENGPTKFRCFVPSSSNIHKPDPRNGIGIFVKKNESKSYASIDIPNEASNDGLYYGFPVVTQSRAGSRRQTFTTKRPTAGKARRRVKRSRKMSPSK